MKDANNWAGYYCTWMWPEPYLNFRCPLTGCGLAINWMLASNYLDVGWPLPVCWLAITWNWPGLYLDLAGLYLDLGETLSGSELTTIWIWILPRCVQLLPGSSVADPDPVGSKTFSDRE
jgi:hypothetical protein